MVIDGDAKKGKRVFNKCKACHKLEAGKNGVGPSLAGLFGRPAAEVEGFRYSDAMINSGIVWTPETLTQYLHKPKDFVPGTKMTFAGLKKDKDINDLLAYLAEELQD
ncbi:MAG: cytochrome c family protein [Rhodobacteraceae bacterium]|nr:cytochrome c family protein [Paracoccaceae bacterium]